MANTSSRKNIAVSAAAVALAAALMIGGTFSYLQDDSAAVVNEFDRNSVYVELCETGATDTDATLETDDDGNETYINDSFTIIPGTSETKDPEVIVTTSVDAYVFLVVTNNTQDLVLYTIDESTWTLIEDLTTKNDDGSTTYVYYTTVDPDNNDENGEQSFYALAGNMVNYSSSLTNDDMYTTDDDGNIIEKTDITLSFQAYAIESDAFNTALSAYYAAVNTVPTATVTVNSNPSTISLTDGSNYIGTITPDITFTFTADETSASSAYADWYVDFYVTFNVSGVDSETLSDWNGYVAVAGQFDWYNSDYWLPIIVQAYDSSTGTTNHYNLCLDCLGTGDWLNYSTLVSTVKTFNCGTAQSVTSNNASDNIVSLAKSTTNDDIGISVPDGVVMTVELRLYKDYNKSTGYGDTYITVETYNYTY